MEPPSPASPAARPPRTITLLSLIPGSGKTVACVNLAVALVGLGHTVVVVDLDPAATATRVFDHFGLPAGGAGTVDAVLAGLVPLAAILRPTLSTRLWLAPAGEGPAPGASKDEDAVMTASRLEFAALAPPLPAFDFALLDTPSTSAERPWLGLLAATEALVPIRPGLDALHASTPTLQLIVEARRQRRDPLRFLGVWPIATTPERAWRAVRAKLREYRLPWLTPIRRVPALKKTLPPGQLHRRLLTIACPRHRANDDFRQAAREIALGISQARALAQSVALPPAGVEPQPRYANLYHLW